MNDEWDDCIGTVPSRAQFEASRKKNRRMGGVRFWEQSASSILVSPP